jgi:hypothetical protein
MGRSQVQRNKTHGRPGQTGRGRGSSGRGGPDRSSRKRQDLSKLGDNSYRFENNKSTNNFSDADDYDGLLDAIHLSSYVEPDDFLDDSGNEHQQDYLSIDVAGMAKCLERLPMAARLNIPLHVGRHLEEMYGGVRKKTLAELREDSMVQSAVVGEVKGSGGQSNGTCSSAKEVNADKDEDDLEAWLDDMIS